MILTASSDKRLLVLGAATLDTVGRPFENLQPGTSVPGQVRPSFGGVARNVAENLARLGLPVSLISAVGDDPIGRQLLEYTAKIGVDTSACLRVGDYGTASYIALLGKEGDLRYGLDDMRILSRLSAEYIKSQAALFQSASLIFVDANLSTPALRAVFQLARRAKLPIFADATSVSLAPKLLPFLPRLTFLTANRLEATALLQGAIEVNDRFSALEAARTFVRMGVQIAIIALAEFGVCYATSETSGHVPAIRTRVIDPTGAGDAMTAAIIFGLTNGMDIDEAVRLGVSAASLTLSHPGSVSPQLSLESLYERLII
ncbi:carbohydrate kinase family protein [Thermanaerothrix sp. 4228-RoL]|uniref:Carbohydrate kinase family protein n=1 Tax=Thermanaerothrix solaris TaxID=3058434 RepID=A0ABU3NK30_9CHLR|nr:carbohydrate kinase family protein [Thermanaerothrix sp. 4228-RoL]MDT8896680.1 carbohydrate kinase family protein [Thermanaerothrix sp. 4228-RoL]